MELCAVLLSWVLHLSDYPPPEGCPEMRRVPSAWLQEQACRGRNCRVLGWYPGGGDVIYLDQRLDLEGELFHASIALHEIVHWVQGRQGALLQDCEASILAEREAYAIQREYLRAYGTHYPTGSALPMLRCAESENP